MDKEQLKDRISENIACMQNALKDESSYEDDNERFCCILTEAERIKELIYNSGMITT